MARIRPLKLVIIAATLIVLSGPALAQEFWAVRGGGTTVEFDIPALERLGLRVEYAGDADAVGKTSAASMVIDAASDLTFTPGADALPSVLGGDVRHLGRLTVATPAAEYAIVHPRLRLVLGPAFASSWCLEGQDGEAGLTLGRTKIGFDSSSRTLVLHSPDLLVSAELAEALGDARLANQPVGRITVRARADWVGGEEPAIAPPQMPLRPDEPEAGPDMIFCQLYGLYQAGRLGDIVGLAVGTTSWNIGDRDMKWFATPNVEHPFIVMNVFRIRNDRFEQIGQSAIKHGFYALGNTQCGGTCRYEPGHGQGNWLGQGCTDTYSAGLNASQNGMAPRFEANGWTGAWTYQGSHMSLGSHPHNAIEHRLQVKDADLNPAQNPGATYYSEGYYLTVDDINPMNSASWKPVTVTGAPGGTWTFGMTGASVRPTDGFAIDAWTGATKTVLAQQVPPTRFVSPDGRCVLAAKATDLGGGTWHYEYALLNVDMQRKVRSFSIPIAPWFAVSNVGFSAVRSHDEPPYSNTPWAAVVTASNVTWSTTDNPVRWAMVYNFRFDAQAPPASESTVTLGLFEPGTPSTVSGITVGPETTMSGDAIRGGLLWDKWWAVNGAPTPTANHPLYPPVGQQSGSVTHRCKECHGWDYKGKDGAYSAGSHYTGIRGVFGSAKSAEEMFQIIKSELGPNGHGFETGMSDADIRDLVQFLKTLVIDTGLYIDAGGAFIGNVAQGQVNYSKRGFTACVDCHGGDGTVINFGTPERPVWVGTVATYNPWELLHKTRFGQPNIPPMASWLAWGGTDQGAADIGAYCQETMPVDCLGNPHCGGAADPCNWILMCSNGRCVPSTLDGDVNLDGFGDGQDIALFVQAVIEGSTAPAILAHADFSGNGMIDPDDVSCMVRTLVTR